MKSLRPLSLLVPHPSASINIDSLDLHSIVPHVAQQAKYNMSLRHNVDTPLTKLVVSCFEIASSWKGSTWYKLVSTRSGEGGSPMMHLRSFAPCVVLPVYRHWHSTSQEDIMGTGAPGLPIGWLPSDIRSECSGGQPFVSRGKMRQRLSHWSREHKFQSQRTRTTPGLKICMTTYLWVFELPHGTKFTQMSGSLMPGTCIYSITW